MKPSDLRDPGDRVTVLLSLSEGGQTVCGMRLQSAHQLMTWLTEFNRSFPRHRLMIKVASDSTNSTPLIVSAERVALVATRTVV